MTNFLLSLTSSTIPAITYPPSACLHRTEPRPSCEILQTLTMVKRAGGIRDSAKWYEMGGKCAWSPSNKMRSRSSDTLERDRTREESDRRAETIVARRPNAKNPGLFRCPRTQPYNRSSVINQTSLPVIAKRPQTNCDRTLSLSLSRDKKLSNGNWMKFRRKCTGSFPRFRRGSAALLLEGFVTIILRRCGGILNVVLSISLLFPRKVGMYFTARFLFASREIIDEKGMFSLFGMWWLFCVHRLNFRVVCRYISFLTFSNLDIFYIRRQTNIRLPFSGIIGEKVNAILLFYINKTL